MARAGRTGVGAGSAAYPLRGVVCGTRERADFGMTRDGRWSHHLRGACRKLLPRGR